MAPSIAHSLCSACPDVVWRSSACCAYCALGRVNATDHLRFFFTRTKLSDNRAHDSIPTTASTAGAGPASITATLAMVSDAEPLAAAAGSSTARLLRGTGVFRTQVHGGTRRCAFPFWWPNSATKWQALQPTTAGAAALDAFDAAALDAFGDLARGHTTRERRRARCLGHLHIDDRRFA